MIERNNFAANQIYRIMYSSEDLERFYFQYQTEALPHGESLQSFCLKNNVPYNIFQKWFKDTRKKYLRFRLMVLLRLPMKKRLKLVTGLNLYQEAVMTIPPAYG